jgi:hypothetical protein
MHSLLLLNLQRLLQRDQFCLSIKAFPFTGLLLMVTKMFLVAFCTWLTVCSNRTSSRRLTTRCGSSYNLRSSGIFYG